MDFKSIAQYLENEDCSSDTLLHIRVELQALMVAIDRRLLKLAKQKDKLRAHTFIEDQNEWLD